MTSELKPCPFCGSDKISISAEAGSDGVGRFYKAECRCGAASKQHFAYEADPETYIDVRKDWNTRATPSGSIGLGGLCETTELLNDLRFRLENMPPDDGTDEALINRIIKRVDQLSATPSADPLAGLVRYEPTIAHERQEHFGMVEHRYGEYVLHSEVAKIVADKNEAIIHSASVIEECNAENESLHVENVRLKNEIAQIKAQRPVAWRYRYKNSANSIWHVRGSVDPYMSDTDYEIEPLYAAPVSDSLKADAARYQYLRSRDLETVREGGIFAGVTPENYVINGIDLDIAIDVFLNVEASNDKG